MFATSGLEVDDRGAHTLKGVPSEWHLFAVASPSLLFTPEVGGRRLPGSPPTVETEQEARELVQGSD